jgi:large subunit ribosomal protein L32
MPNPKRKHSRSRRDKRRSANSKLFSVNLSTCPHCKKIRLPHRVCPFCGYYNGKPVIIIKEKEGKSR